MGVFLKKPFGILIVEMRICYFISMRFHFPIVVVCFWLFACSDINSGWTVDGGGYMNLQLNGSEKLKLDISPDDGDVDLRVNKHFVLFLGKNDQGDRLQLMVYKPVLGLNTPQTNPNYTYLVLGNSVPAHIIDADSSYVKFDRKDSILWSADIRLIFNHCYGDDCDSTRTVVSGRMQYWVDPDDR